MCSFKNISRKNFSDFPRAFEDSISVALNSIFNPLQKIALKTSSVQEKKYINLHFQYSKIAAFYNVFVSTSSVTSFCLHFEEQKESSETVKNHAKILGQNGHKKY